MGAGALPGALRTTWRVVPEFAEFASAAGVAQALVTSTSMHAPAIR
ncbi:hypothetical protein [Nonomuraea basaltis]|nr:hypothetical protein [Nonomuraea basaltis]